MSLRLLSFSAALRLCASAVGFVFAVNPALAQDWNFGGHIKYQYTYTDYRPDDLNAVFGDDPAQDQGLDVRLKAGNRGGPWDTETHYELLGVAGDTLATRRALAAAGRLTGGNVSGLPDDRRRLFDLTDEVTDRDRLVAVQRLDRLSVGYTSGGQVLRFGRQAVSWGNGLVFQPIDFINPFSPIAVDKDYKTGDDMFYGQWLHAGGGDIQGIVVPRRDPATRDLKSDQSSYAAKLHWRGGEFDVDVLAARHFSDNLIALGAVRSLGGAVWRMDVSYTGLDGGGDAVSLVTNMDYSWTWGGKNAYGYIEYFRSGVGQSDRAGYTAPPPELAERVARGELFTLARDYAAVGLRIELTPLFNLHSQFIWNLVDGSRFLQIRGVYDWRQNMQLMAGVNLPSGDRGDEYGGVPVPGTGAFATPGRSVYLRIAYYF